LEDLLAVFCVVLLLKLNGDQISSSIIVTGCEVDSQKEKKEPTDDTSIDVYSQ